MLFFFQKSPFVHTVLEIKLPPILPFSHHLATMAQHQYQHFKVPSPFILLCSIHTIRHST